MASRRAHIAPVVAVLLSAAGLAGCVNIPPLNTGTQSLSAAASPAGVLDIQTANGAIDVRRADVSQITVEATIRAAGQDRLDRTRVVVEPAADGGARIFVDWPDGGRRGNEGCSLVVQTPGAGGLSARTSNGPVHVEGLSGPATIDTSNGRVEIAQHAGPVRIDTSNGRIMAREVQGDVVLDTSNGRIEVENVTGAVRADTSNGAVTIRLSPDAAGPIDISTSNGSVRVDVGPAFAGIIDAGTSNGTVSVQGASGVDGSTRRCTARFGDSAARSVIRTSNGSVVVSRTGPEGTGS